MLIQKNFLKNMLFFLCTMGAINCCACISSPLDDTALSAHSSHSKEFRADRSVFFPEGLEKHYVARLNKVFETMAEQDIARLAQDVLRYDGIIFRDGMTLGDRSDTTILMTFLNAEKRVRFVECVKQNQDKIFVPEITPFDYVDLLLSLHPLDPADIVSVIDTFELGEGISERYNKVQALLKEKNIEIDASIFQYPMEI